MNPTTKYIVDAFASGSLNTKTPELARVLIETLATNKYQVPSKKQKGVFYIDTIDAFLAQSKLLIQAMTTMT